MRKIEAHLTLTFSNEDDKVNLQTNGVPTSLIIEHLINLNQFLAQQLLDEAKEEVPEDGYEAYLEGRIKEDRKILKDLINKPNPINITIGIKGDIKCFDCMDSGWVEDKRIGSDGINKRCHCKNK